MHGSRGKDLWRLRKLAHYEGENVGKHSITLK